MSSVRRTLAEDTLEHEGVLDALPGHTGIHHAESLSFQAVSCASLLRAQPLVSHGRSQEHGHAAVDLTCRVTSCARDDRE